MLWTDEKSATLKKAWEQGLTSSEIAERLGGDATRTGVARKRARMGLPPRSGVVLALAQTARGRACGTGLRALPRRPTPLGIARAARMGALAGSTPRPWTQRMHGECCFPVAGDGADTWSCCLPVARQAGLYCDGHVAILAGRPWPPQDAKRELIDA